MHYTQCCDHVGYYGLDFDGTLAEHLEGGGVEGTGKPINAMVELVKYWVRSGIPIRIITARIRVDMANDGALAWNKYQTKLVQDFLQATGLPCFPVQAHKCFHMERLYDDRAIQVECGTGRVILDSIRVQDLLSASRED